MFLFQQSEAITARRDVFIQMVDAVDQVTPKTGLAPAVAIVKAGAASYASIAGTCVEVSDGTYRISLAAADLDTLGQAMLKITASGAAPQFIPLQVVRFLDEVHLAKAALLNARTHTIDTGVDQVMDDDGITALRTLTPSESNGIITVTPT
jgi:hypothetical protein